MVAVALLFVLARGALFILALAAIVEALEALDEALWWDGPPRVTRRAVAFAGLTLLLAVAAGLALMDALDAIGLALFTGVELP